MGLACAQNAVSALVLDGHICGNPKQPSGVAPSARAARSALDVVVSYLAGVAIESITV